MYTTLVTVEYEDPYPIKKEFRIKAWKLHTCISRAMRQFKAENKPSRSVKSFRIRTDVLDHLSQRAFKKLQDGEEPVAKEPKAEKKAAPKKVKAVKAVKPLKVVAEKKAKVKAPVVKKRLEKAKEEKKEAAPVVSEKKEGNTVFQNLFAKK